MKKITIFTGNQLRHIGLINRLARLGGEIHAIMESTTLFPGEVEDFYAASKPMSEYMNKVKMAEQSYFSGMRFVEPNVKILVCKSGDLNKLGKEDLGGALNSDLYLVFGSSYIKGWLCNFLEENRAYNLHMGLSPYYRGSACNFWAVFDGNPNFVGATWHFLTKGLDSGPIVFHSVPTHVDENAFEFTMKAVLTAQEDFIKYLNKNLVLDTPGCQQEKGLQIRNSRYSDFTDSVATDFLNRDTSFLWLEKALRDSPLPRLIKGID